MKCKAFYCILVMVGWFWQGGLHLYAQSLRGVVTEAETGEPIIGATVVLKGTTIGTITEMDGSYTLKDIVPGRYNVEAKLLGYDPMEVQEVLIAGNKEVIVNFALKENNKLLGEIVIRPTVSKEKAVNPLALVGARMLNMEEASRYAGGYSDPARLVTSFAGVAGSPDNNGISVHGNAPQSLSWRLEGIEINSPNHFTDAFCMGTGVVSALSSNVLANSDFYSGAMTAEYGNALSGVMDMHMKAGDAFNFKHAIQLGTLGVVGTSEGPLSRKTGASYIINYRYSFTTLARKIGILSTDGDQADFQDVNFKFNFPTKKAGTFALFGLGMKDKYWNDVPDFNKWETVYDQEYLESRQTMFVGGLTHNVYLGKGWKWNTAVAYSLFKNDGDDYYADYYYHGNAPVSSDCKFHKYAEMRQKNQQFTIQTGLQKRFSEGFLSKLGVSHNEYYFDINLNMADAVGAATLKPIYGADKHTGLLTAYLSNSWQWNRWMTFNFGVNSEYFRLTKEKTIEPRAALQWNPDKANTFSLGYGLHSKLEKMDVYFYKDENGHYANRDLDMSKAHHFLLSWMHRFNDKTNLRVETYYQYLYDLPVENDINSTYCVLNRREYYVDKALNNEGKGRNYGVDVTLERYMSGGWYGMINGSLYKSEYKAMDGIWRNTLYNRSYLFKVLGGKEWMMGKRNQNVLSVNAKFTMQGGLRRTPGDLDATKALYDAGHIAADVVLKDKEAFSKQYDALPIVDLTVSYKIAGKHCDHTIAIEALNLTNAKPPYCDTYNYKNNCISTTDAELSFPNIYYRITF